MNNGIKVRVFDMAHGLREYENITIIRIISKDYNLLIMKRYHKRIVQKYQSLLYE